MALGELAMLPSDFWSLQPREWELMATGLVRRRRRTWYQVASLGRWLLLPWLDKRKTLTPEQLLGWKDTWKDE